jgi:hypothetical protein
METGNGGDKAEAEPIARRTATPFQPVKALEDVLAFIGGNSRSVIRDRNDRTAIPSDLHRHPTGFTAMFDRVVDEIRHGIEQEVSIARYEYSSIHDSIEMRMPVFRGRHRIAPRPRLRCLTSLRCGMRKFDRPPRFEIFA